MIKTDKKLMIMYYEIAHDKWFKGIKKFSIYFFKVVQKKIFNRKSIED